MTLAQFEGLRAALAEFLEEALAMSGTPDPDWLLSEEGADVDLFLYGMHTRGFRGMYQTCESMSRARCAVVEQRAFATGRKLPRGC